MITLILKLLGTPADVRSGAAIIVGALATVLGSGHVPPAVVGVIDAGAALVVAIDTAFHQSRTKQAEKSSQDRLTALAVKASTSSTPAPPVVVAEKATTVLTPAPVVPLEPPPPGPAPAA